MRVRLQPYKAASASARVLSRALGIKRVRLVRTRFRPRQRDVILNWGSADVLFPGANYINHPHAVDRATNKLTAMRVLTEAGVVVPPWTDMEIEAQAWLNDGVAVVARRMLRASGGRGIVVADPGDMLPRAPLYTQYVKKFDEYRVHVWDGEVIDIQQKRRRRGGEQEVDQRVRNSAGGWVFCREEVQCPEVVIEQAVKAVRALGLDFGAADCGFTRKRGTACVYEVNTAPGLQGTTERTYTRAAHESLDRRRRAAHIDANDAVGNYPDDGRARKAAHKYRDGRLHLMGQPRRDARQGARNERG